MKLQKLGAEKKLSIGCFVSFPFAQKYSCILLLFRNIFIGKKYVPRVTYDNVCSTFHSKLNFWKEKGKERREIPDGTIFYGFALNCTFAPCPGWIPLDPSSVSFGDRSFSPFFFLYFTSFISSSIRHYDRSRTDSRSINFNQSTMYLRISRREKYICYILMESRKFWGRIFPQFFPPRLKSSNLNLFIKLVEYMGRNDK